LYNDEEALSYYNDALEIRRRILGKNNLDVANCYLGIGDIYNCKGNYDEALKIYLKALNIEERVYSKNKNNLDLAECFGNVASVYAELGEFDKSIINFRKKLEIFENLYEEDNIELAKVYYDLGSALYLNDDLKEALDYYLKSIKIREKKSLELKEDRITAIYYNQIGIIYNGLGYLDRSLEYFNKALRIFKKIDEPDSDDIKKIQRNVRKVNKKIFK